MLLPLYAPTSSGQNKMACLKAETMESQNQLPQSEQQGKGTTFLKTCFNGLNALAGVGILSIPYALSQGGWLSLMLLFLVASLCCYTGLLIQRCMEANPVIKSYPDIGEIAFGSKGRAMISAFMYLELYLIAVEFLILEGDSLEKLFPNMGFKIVGLKVGGKQAFVLLTALVILPTTWLKNLGVMAYLSAGGVLATIAVVICVLWTGVGEGVGFHEGNMFVNVGGLPTAISLFTFCYSGHAVFPTLCNSMKDRSQFSKVLLVCFLVSTITYGFMGIIGYLMYGDILKSQVTLNLPIRKISTSIAIYTTLISPLTKYAVIITPIATAIEEKFSLGKIRVIGILIRTVLVISTVFVACSVPFFGYVMAFIGASLSVTVSMLFPCMCYLKMHKRAQSFGLKLVIIAGILVAASFIGVVGTYTSLKQIVNHL